MAAPMQMPRYLSTATRLGDGRVLVTGNNGVPTLPERLLHGRCLLRRHSTPCHIALVGLYHLFWMVRRRRERHRSAVAPN
jgi:hypothetical protein